MRSHRGALSFLICRDRFGVLSVPNSLCFWTPMERFWILLLVILSLFHQTASAGDTTEVIRAVGGSVTFRSHSTRGYATFWTFEDEPVVITEFKDPPQPSFFKKKFRTRFAVSEKGRALTISQLSMEDAGTYTANIRGKTSTFTLRVYRELAKPRVTCEAQKCSDRSCFLFLHCSVPGAGFGNVSYTWRAQGQLWELQSMLLVMDRSSQDELEPVTCTARNAVSSRNVTVTTPGVLCPGALSGKSFGIGLAVGIGVAALLLVFLVFCKSRGYCRALHGRVSEWCGRDFSHHQATPPELPQCQELAMDQCRDQPGTSTDQLGPVPGLATDQHNLHCANGDNLMGNETHNNLSKAEP